MNDKFLKDCVEYEVENEYIDFKIKPYDWKDEEKKCDFLTDILSFANANVNGDRYIILGVKPKSDGTRNYRGLSKNEMEDSAEYQQLVSENIEPSLSIESKIFLYNGKNYGVIRIFNCNNRPYLMKKKYGRLEQGFTKIRRGSRNNNLTRYFLDEIYEMKNKKIKSDFKIFGLKDGQLSPTIKPKKFDFLPNMVDEKEEIIKLLTSIKNYNIDDYTLQSKSDEEEIPLILADKLKINPIFPPQKIEIEESVKNIINSFADVAKIKLSDDFYDIGNLKKRFTGISGNGISVHTNHQIEGSDKSIKKYNMILELGQRLERALSWLKFIEQTKNIEYIELAIKEIGNTDDEEIEVNIEIPKDKYVDCDLFPEPKPNIISEINEIYSEQMFKPNYSDNISDFRRMPMSTAYTQNHKFSPIIGPDCEILDGLYDYIDYNVEKVKNKIILNFTIKNIKEDEIMVFPGNILINEKLDEIRYSIISKKAKNKITGILKINNKDVKD